MVQKVYEERGIYLNKPEIVDQSNVPNETEQKVIDTQAEPSLEQQAKTLGQWDIEADKKLKDAKEEDIRNESTEYSEMIFSQEYSKKLLSLEVAQKLEQEITILNTGLDLKNAELEQVKQELEDTRQLLKDVNENCKYKKQIGEANKILNDFPQENMSKYWMSRCDDNIQDEFKDGVYFTDLKEWLECLCVALSATETPKCEPSAAKAKCSGTSKLLTPTEESTWDGAKVRVRQTSTPNKTVQSKRSEEK